MGESDEDAVQAALSTDPVYLGVVASGKRFAQIRDSLVARGIPAAALARIKNPAGLDIGAETPEEIAASIVAEIVQVRRREAREPAAAPAILPTAAPRKEIDPVCGMAVDVASAKHRADAGGRSWYFCCAGCREKFLAAPAKFGAAASAEARG
jgi:xanthine dehydrogenase accessory factor